MINNIDDLLAAFHLDGSEIHQVDQNWAEGVVRFLNNGIVSSILIMIGFFGILAEIKSPGWGVPGTAGLIALALFFGSSYILELASAIEIIMFVLGVILILLEVFVIPGFGIAGVGGIILIIASLFLSLIGSNQVLDFEGVSTAIIQLAAALSGAIILLFMLAKFLPKTNIFQKFVLSEAEKSNKGFSSHKTQKSLVGAKGVALTTLRPSGTAEINGKKVDVVTESEYLERGSKIEVIGVEGIKVLVKEIRSDEKIANE
ncbi:MAG: NfeD family protein [Ignavibacteriaceae bacterium]